MHRLETIEWAYTPRTSRALCVLVHVPVAVLGGAVLLTIVLIGWGVVGAIRAGDIEALATDSPRFPRVDRTR
jgi:hypothetical protein